MPMDTTPVLDWYGDLLSDHVADAPEAVRGWLRLGFDLKRTQTELAPNRAYLPSGRMAARIALQSVTRALDDYGHAVITSIFLPSEPFLALGTPETLAMAQQLERDLPRALAHEGISLVWAHIPPFFLRGLRDHLDLTQEAQIVASDMVFDQVGPAPPAYGPDQPFEALAERMLRNSFNGSATRRADRLSWLAHLTQADGAVVFCHWGCKETAGASRLIARRLEAEGVPTLVLDGDGCERANCMEGQMTTRFDAFREMLRDRRARSQEGVSDV